jgi:integrase/recombinase XerD
MATVKLFPRLDKLNDNGKAPIYMRLTKNRKSKYIALEAWIRPEDWDEKTGKVKPSTPNSYQLNYYLVSKELEAESIALEMETRSKSVTAVDVKARILGKVPGDFFTFAEKYGKMMSPEWSVGNYRKFLSVLTKFKVYNKGKRLYFDEVTVSLIRDFQRYLLEELGNKLNTVQSNLKVLRRVIIEAISDELIPYEKNPFLKIKIKCEKSHRLYLLDDELERLKKLRLSPKTKMECHRDLYLFSANTGGIRISDLLLLRWRNFDQTHVTFRMKKTQEEISIKVPDESLAILSRYYQLAKSRHPGEKVNKNAFIFPLLKLDPTELDREKVHNAISAATSYTNKDLGKLSKMAGLDKRITFHTARHSWAIRALQRGMRIEYVSKILGHASVKQTEVYARVMNIELDKAMEIFNRPLVPFG